MKVQNVLVVVILGAMLNFLIGVIMGPQSSEDLAKGFVGFSGEVLKQNLFPDYRVTAGVQQNFFTIFGIFFPSVTGIQAGANVSGM